MAKLTPKQERFIQEYVTGRCTQTEAARRAGYAVESAKIRASELLNSLKFPHVVDKVNDLRKELAKKYEISYETHIKDLAELREKSVNAGNLSAAVMAETRRGMAAGLYIDRKEVMHGKIETMSKEDIVKRIMQLSSESDGALPAPAKIVEGNFSIPGEVDKVE